ncbi:DNA-binding response regulator, partial [Paenibacillus barengoltzii]|nr:DNA-binding response regulator [Paenibacillus barengoltzii]
LKHLIAETEEAKRARDEQLSLQEKLSHLLPLAENELSLMLMLEYAQEVEADQLARMLNLQWRKGYAMVLSFAKHNPKEWASFQVAKKEIYEAVKQWAKPGLSCLVSPVVGHKIALFIPLPPGRPGYEQRVMALEWGERLRSQVEERFGLPLSVGIGGVREGWDGLSRSYREAVRVCAEEQDIVCVRHYDDIAESSGSPAISLDEEKKLLDALLQQDKAEAAERFNLLFERLQEERSDDFPHLRGDVIGLLLYLSRGVEAGDGPELIEDL